MKKNLYKSIVTFIYFLLIFILLIFVVGLVKFKYFSDNKMLFNYLPLVSISIYFLYLSISNVFFPSLISVILRYRYEGKKYKLFFVNIIEFGVFFSYIYLTGSKENPLLEGILSLTLLADMLCICFTKTGSRLALFIFNLKMTNI